MLSAEANAPVDLCAFSKRRLNLLQAAEPLWRRELDGEHEIRVGFSTWLFVQATLPHKDPGTDINVWTRRNGKALLTIQQGYRVGADNSVEPIGYPYGVIPRLILIYLATAAVQTRNPNISLGRSMREFMNRIGLSSSGRPCRMLKKQAIRLFAAKIQYSWDGATKGDDNGIAARYRLWWDDKDANNESLWESSVVLNQKLFDEIIARPLPLDLYAVCHIKGSALALDLYGWLADRVFELPKPVRVPWKALHRQVGSAYADIANFKKKAKAALGLVALFWPALKYEIVVGGVLVLPSPTPVPRTNKAG